MQTVTNKLRSIDELLTEGPVGEDYARVNAYFFEEYQKDPVQFLEQFKSIREKVEAFHSSDSIAGFCYLQPYGYAGDFQLIDRLYTNYRGPGKAIGRWDDFAQSQPAAQAVRNRKAYFIDLLQTLTPENVLNVASGPCRDVREYFQKYPDSTTLFHCIELDAKAIHYARKLLADDTRVSFIQQSALLYKPSMQYDLVWSAGLFDYFADNVFVKVLRKLMNSVAPGGELVIGNFAADNPNRAFMEVGMDWFLHHRSPDQLIHLAHESGAGKWLVTVRKEPESVNLFLHLKRPV